ncbi:DMT family transporter [Brassicibacter mesophilus]|uniref:DMT family transporter n=1 Tax=Brassicibacter mesophilus TaxID=745119 RepID=UPI003D1A0DF4
MENRSKGILLIISASLFFALMSATVKSLHGISVVEKMFFRNAVGLIVASLVIIKKKQSFIGNNKGSLFLRSFFGLLGVACNYYAISKLPLAEAEILNKMSPFFVIILSAIFLSEKIRKNQFVTIILAFAGALLVIKPGFNFSLIPALIGLTSAFFAGSAYTTIRHLRHTDSPDVIVFYFTLFSTLVTVPIMLASNFTIPSAIQLISLIGIGVFATTAQFLLTYAYRYAPAGELSIYTYVNIVFSIIIGFIIWNEVPDLLSFLGGTLIIIAGYINYRFRVSTSTLNNNK